MTLAWQESLFDDHPGGDGGLSFSGVRRRALDERCWLDLASGWLPNHGELFDELHESAPWQQRERRMHDKDVLEPRLVTVGLGERRRFLLRPGTSGPPAVRLETGHGDLVVMGGRTQHEWQHTVPKAAKAGARMSVNLRHSRALG